MIRRPPQSVVQMSLFKTFNMLRLGMCMVTRGTLSPAPPMRGGRERKMEGKGDVPPLKFYSYVTAHIHTYTYFWKILGGSLWGLAQKCVRRLSIFRILGNTLDIISTCKSQKKNLFIFRQNPGLKFEKKNLGGGGNNPTLGKEQVLKFQN